MHGQHFFCDLIYKVFSLTEKSLRQIGNSWCPTHVSEFFPYCRTIIVKNQQNIVFDNVRKTIIVHNIIAIIVIYIYFLTPLSSTTWYFVLKHSANYYGIVQLPNSPVRFYFN